LLHILKRAVCNDVTTGRSAEYPGLKPLVVTHGTSEVLEVASQVAQSTPGWRNVVLDSDGQRLSAEAVSRVNKYVDDLTIWLEENEGVRALYVRSKSRVGKGDLGANARRISRFLNRVRQELAQIG
jgi:uncharacterized protein (DUF1499 family)